MPTPRPAWWSACFAVPAVIGWALGLGLICAPLWALSIIFLKLSNWCLAGAYRLRDALAALGDKLEPPPV